MLDVLFWVLGLVIVCALLWGVVALITLSVRSTSRWYDRRHGQEGRARRAVEAENRRRAREYESHTSAISRPFRRP
jgi:hypothetical protein